jgi:hypothetical protein
MTQHRHVGRRRHINRDKAIGSYRWLVTVACCFAIGCSGVRSRLNDEKAEQVMKDIRSAEATFKQRRAKYGELRELIDAGVLSNSLAGGVAFEHQFQVRANATSYESVSVPTEKNDQLAYVGWSFYLDESGVIRGCAYGKANRYVRAGRHDPPIRSQ